jgi:hypothetical protein
VSPVRYELGFYIPEDGILHSHHRENLKAYEAKMYLLALPCVLTCILQLESCGLEIVVI